MRIIITGSLGHISRPLTQALVQQGHAVTVISSKAEKQAAIEALGATAAIGSLEDVDFLTATFTGADAVYAMVPPNFAIPDFRPYYNRLGRNYAQAIAQAGVKRVVHLSSYGADLDHGTGIILGAHDVEQLLNALPGVALTHLRPVYFYYNFYNLIGMIKTAGFIGTNYGGEDKLLLVAPADIAAAAAEELTKPAVPGQDVRYIASDERTATETARILGAAIGKPDLQWVVLPDEQYRSGMEQSGMPAQLASDFTDLGISSRSGAMRRDYDRNPPQSLGKVKLEDFAKEFAAAF
ncbi:NAD(P)H-binding protein [Hymenobacter sp. BT523]|uniref:NmrA family NAD(P)-binding protein n=1 Tax=Hymenobacter sp. BT523 TaxID=2795725 RepID=UPI0018EC521D|nr:NAD(P)H-binding protein [Hymenobacter sp. BT523]MBJ6108662.1 NAD(P)H-binding protein [Hymenobacter sp. BT523]